MYEADALGAIYSFGSIKAAAFMRFPFNMSLGWNPSRERLPPFRGLQITWPALSRKQARQQIPNSRLTPRHGPEMAGAVCPPAKHVEPVVLFEQKNPQ
jgi:hypothetical protein